MKDGTRGLFCLADSVDNNKIVLAIALIDYVLCASNVTYIFGNL